MSDHDQEPALKRPRHTDITSADEDKAKTTVVGGRSDGALQGADTLLWEERMRLDAAAGREEGPSGVEGKGEKPGEGEKKAQVKEVGIDTSRLVLIIYTGGTIGMKKTPEGYTPAYDYLMPYLQQNPLFRDQSVPILKQHDGTEVVTTPMTTYGRPMQFSLIELHPLIDSSNIKPQNWVRIANVIAKHYDRYNAFLILHGTDTMAFTASALSFMLQNLHKTVIITGSQVPLSRFLSDGQENLLGALTFASNYVLPEVSLYFAHKLLRGNRCTKTSASKRGAFDSPNMRPLAELGISPTINWHDILPPRLGRFRASTKLCPNVVAIRVFPGLSHLMLKHFLAPPCQGAVLETYGSGNAPDDSNFCSVLQEACQRGVVIVNITQCSTGKVEAHYATGTALARAGVIPGFDMTPEAALTKLCFLLGQGLSLEKVKERFTQVLCGEHCGEKLAEKYSLEDSSFIRSLAAALNVKSTENKQLCEALLPTVICAAAAAGNLKDLEDLTRDAATARLCDYDGRTALHLAAAEGHFKCVRHLVEAGGHVNARDRWGHTPLLEAIRGPAEEAEAMRGAEAAGAQDGVVLVKVPPQGPASGESEGGEVAARDAEEAHQRRLSIVKLLVEAHADPLGLTTPEALCEKAFHNDGRFFERYLAAGGDCDLLDYDRRSPLMIAAGEGHMQLVRTLVEAGANVNLRDRWNGTCLDAALLGRHGAITTYLHEKTQVKSVLEEVGLAQEGATRSGRDARESTATS